MVVPKTIDNDLPITDHCPGFGSIARFVASALQDVGRDTEAMHRVDPVKIVEVMGRNAGWVVAASASPSSQECITMLNAGADYYLDAWLAPPELVARVRVVLRFSAWLDDSDDHGTLDHPPIANAAGSRTHQ